MEFGAASVGIHLGAPSARLRRPSVTGLHGHGVMKSERSSLRGPRTCAGDLEGGRAHNRTQSRRRL